MNATPSEPLGDGSADLQSAVPPICNRQSVGLFERVRTWRHPAECNSAKQQSATLRYELAGRSADFPVCGFRGLSSPQPDRTTGKSPEPAGWKARSTGWSAGRPCINQARLLAATLWLAGAFLVCAGDSTERFEPSKTFTTRPGELSFAFDRANKLYEEGKFAEAAAAYETLVQQNKVSAALYFNLGNAQFKRGQVGRAIVNYRLAARLTPRDPDVRANLQFARDSVRSGTGSHWPRWRRFLHELSLNEITVIATAAAWTWFTLLALKQFRPSLNKTLSGYTATAGFAALLAALWFAALWQDRYQVEDAVVVAPEAVVRYGPLEESQSFYTVHDGAELSVLERLNDWIQVEDAVKRVGWIESKQVVVVPRG